MHSDLSGTASGIGCKKYPGRFLFYREKCKGDGQQGNLGFAFTCFIGEKTEVLEFVRFLQIGDGHVLRVCKRFYFFYQCVEFIERFDRRIVDFEIEYEIGRNIEIDRRFSQWNIAAVEEANESIGGFNSELTYCAAS